MTSGVTARLATAEDFVLVFTSVRKTRDPSSRTAADMTTESQKHTPGTGGSVLLGAAGAALVAGLAVALAGALVAGAAAAYGALAGTALAVLVFAFGAGVVHVVAGLLPAASLLVALLTYVLQVVAMALVLVALDGSGLMDATLDRRWLAGAVVVGTFAWIGTQVVLHARARIPVYELPGQGGGQRPEAGAR